MQEEQCSALMRSSATSHVRRRPDFVAGRHADHAGGAVLGLDAIFRDEPRETPARQIERCYVCFMQGLDTHTLTRFWIVSAICWGVSPNAWINSSYVPEWMKRGRPTASSVLMVKTRRRSTPLLPCR